MSGYIRKSHNVSSLIYHLVCPTKYRRNVITEPVDKTLKEVCLGIEDRYEIEFLEIGTDKDHVHFLIQTIPEYRMSDIVKKIKSITGKEIFEKHPEVKKQLWGGAFWTSGYFLSTVGKHTNEEAIVNYIKEQGNKSEYEQLHLKV
jgi:REP element-mobilizing transposase RayT